LLGRLSQRRTLKEDLVGKGVLHKLATLEGESKVGLFALVLDGPLQADLAQNLAALELAACKLTVDCLGEHRLKLHMVFNIDP